jgi:methylated-DNA-[protein]-cysteine S-methyltransferase
MSQKRSGESKYFDALETPFGKVYLILAGVYLTGLSFERPAGMVRGKPSAFALPKRQLSEYFEKERRAFTLPTLFLEGTDFEHAVWSTLREVPYGETRTYKWLAEKIGKPHAFRAVGNALAKNPIPIIFPCHRIIESDGSLGGYSGGIDIKRRLLELEYYNNR